MLNLFALPRVSWKVRLLFTILAAVFVSVILQQWPHRQDDLAIARWIAWFSIVGGVFTLPRILVVVVFGRLPKVYAQISGSLNKTLPQIRTDITREQQESRERSREL